VFWSSTLQTCCIRQRCYYHGVRLPLTHSHIRANLSEQYFTNRVDRYHLIKSSERLAIYFEQLFDLIASISFELVKSTDKVNFREGNEKSFLGFKKRLELLNSKNQLDPREKQCDTVLVPSIQLAALEIYNDQHLLDAFLLFINEHFYKSAAFFSTGYFNPSNTILEHILRSRNTWSIITSSPATNSFYKSKGLAGFLPSMYRTNLISASDYLSSNKLSTPTLFEHTKPNWTFHAKGILVADGCGRAAYVIGSSNFGKLTNNFIFMPKVSVLLQKI
jgi:CDP-diacylglycerol--glycerol-3-phosphate 3-phosphatidyltransferase